MNTTNWPEGIKKTKQREAIWSVLTTTDKPITAMEIAERLGDGSYHMDVYHLPYT
ncbi:MAG: hypothetical protein ACLUPK_04165 [Veillonella sp.]